MVIVDCVVKLNTILFCQLIRNSHTLRQYFANVFDVPIRYFDELDVVGLCVVAFAVVVFG